MKCVFCGCEVVGHGNNPAPAKKRGRCCDACNSTVVIPSRLGMVMSPPKWHFFIDTNLGEGEAIKSGSGELWEVSLPTGGFRFDGNVVTVKRKIVKYCQEYPGSKYTHCFGRKLPKRKALKWNPKLLIEE